MKFYMYTECGACGEDVFSGVCLVLSNHKTLPAIPFDMASQTRFDCDECGASTYIGEFTDVCVEMNPDDRRSHAE